MTVGIEIAYDSLLGMWNDERGWAAHLRPLWRIPARHGDQVSALWGTQSCGKHFL